MLLALSECTSKPSTGTVDGVFETLGGLATAGHHDLPGTVVFTNGQRSHSSVKVGANGASSPARRNAPLPGEVGQFLDVHFR